MPSAHAETLPTPDDCHTAGIYFLFADDGELLYIGSSTLISERLKQHRAAGKIRFSHYCAIEMRDIPFGCFGEHIMRFIEAAYIDALTPPMNERFWAVEPELAELRNAIDEAWKPYRIVTPALEAA